MTTQQLLEYCLAKTGAYIDHPFGPDSTILKVGRTENRSGRIFAQFFLLKGKETVTLNCDMMTGQFYRGLFPGVVVRGYHCPPIQQPYFNTLPLDGAVPDHILLEMADHSYRTVVGKLPKSLQKKLAEGTIRKAQSAFSGAAEAIGISGEEDVQALVDEVRCRKR